MVKRLSQLDCVMGNMDYLEVKQINENQIELVVYNTFDKTHASIVLDRDKSTRLANILLENIK